jgi:hypothetical protein
VSALERASNRAETGLGRASVAAAIVDSPPGNENATRQGGALLTDYDAMTVSQPDRRVNGIDAPPAGFGWENGELVPVAMHSALLPEPAPLTPERIALRAMMEWVLLCDGHKGKVVAFYYLIGEDTRRLGEIAEALKITRRTFENYRNECALWLDGFVAGSESASISLSGIEVTP